STPVPAAAPDRPRGLISPISPRAGVATGARLRRSGEQVAADRRSWISNRRARATALAFAVVVAAPPVDAEPKRAMVEVAPGCAQVVDTDEVVVALRVELGSVGVGSASARAGGDVALAVDCPSPHEVVIAVGGRRMSIAVAEIAPPARARVVALTVAEQLR